MSSVTEENTAAHQLSKEAPGKLGEESVHRANTRENTTPNTTSLSQQKWEWEGDVADGSKVGQINQSHETLANFAAFAGMCLISWRFLFLAKYLVSNVQSFQECKLLID